jgi:hypothetical protein
MSRHTGARPSPQTPLGRGWVRGEVTPSDHEAAGDAGARPSPVLSPTGIGERGEPMVSALGRHREGSP